MKMSNEELAMSNEIVEMRIIYAVRKLLTERVNELLGKVQYAVPIVEIGNYGGASVIVPDVFFASCERSEKERIIKLDAYSPDDYFFPA